MAQVYCILNAELEIIHVLFGVCLSVCLYPYKHTTIVFQNWNSEIISLGIEEEDEEVDCCNSVPYVFHKLKLVVPLSK